MLKEKKDALTAKILSSISDNIKPIEYLVGLLNISKESAYRRLRGEIPFTFKEIAKMAVDLNFSVDELLSKNKNSQVFFSIRVDNPTDDSAFLRRMENYYQSLRSISNAQDVEVLIAMNNIYPFFLVHFDALYKFSYFKSIHYNAEISSKNRFDEINMPHELINVQKNIKQLISTSSFNYTLIIDSNIYTNLINEILYYHKRKLISKEDLLVLKKDLLALVDKMEETTQTGYFSEQLKMNIYLSFINVNANSTYVRHDDKEISCFHPYAINAITTDNQSICSIHKKKLDALKKYATLITQSNEIIQSTYFDHQRANIQHIEEANIGFGF